MTSVFSLLCFLGSLLTVFCACPSGWTRYDNSCYHVSRDTETWAEAMKLCEVHGSNLATIETAAENQYIQTILGAQRHSGNFWIGGSDWDNEGEWKWAPKEVQFSFSNWHKGQPDNAANTEHCLVLKRGYHYQWADDNCHTAYHYVCERSDLLVSTVTQEPLVG